jgi:hypothetical protein
MQSNLLTTKNLKLHFAVNGNEGVAEIDKNRKMKNPYKKNVEKM